MKNIIYIAVAILVWYVVSIHQIDQKCKTLDGWEYYAVLPVPMCHAGQGVQPLQNILHPLYNYENPTIYRTLIG